MVAPRAGAMCAEGRPRSGPGGVGTRLPGVAHKRVLMVAATKIRAGREIRAARIAAVIVDKNPRAVTARAVLPAKGRVVFDGVAKSLAAQPELLRPHRRE